MGPEVSLPCSQEPAFVHIDKKCPAFTEPKYNHHIEKSRSLCPSQLNPIPALYILYPRPILILFSRLHLGFPRDHFGRGV
jgi:hypothetical protein